MKSCGQVAALGSRSSVNSADLEMGAAAAPGYGGPSDRTATESAS
jgi:hypothetical protein